MGLDKGPEFNEAIEEKTLRLRAGDRLVFYTKGVVEMRNEGGEQFGQERFLSWAQENSGLRSRAFLRGVLRMLEEHRGETDQEHDVTAITIALQ